MPQVVSLCSADTHCKLPHDVVYPFQIFMRVCQQAMNCIFGISAISMNLYELGHSLSKTYLNNVNKIHIYAKIIDSVYQACLLNANAQRLILLHDLGAWKQQVNKTNTFSDVAKHHLQYKTVSCVFYCHVQAS